MDLNTPQDIDIIIARYLAREASAEETELLLRWIEASEANRRSFFEIQDTWHALHPPVAPGSIDTARAERKVLARAGLMRKRKKLWLQTALAAGVAALIAFGAYRAATADSTPQVPEYTVSTAYGYTMEALLPDGSRVWLNANSTLRYPAQFGDGDRAVHLSGEAYFSVSADATHPFRVHAHDITVTATGTQFNVNAYDISPCSSVTLVEGKVDVAAGGHIYSMNSGEHLNTTSGRTRVAAVEDVAKYCSWRDGVLIFDNDRLADICSRLEQIYNVDFEIDPAVAPVNFHIILKGENISEIMRMLEMSAPIACTAAEPADSCGVKPRQHISISAR